MEHEGSLPPSQQPATCPYPKPARSMFSHPTSLRSILILSSHLRLGLQSDFISIRFPHQNPVYKSPVTHTCYTHPPSSFFSVLSPEQYWVRSTDSALQYYYKFKCHILDWH